MEAGQGGLMRPGRLIMPSRASPSTCTRQHDRDAPDAVEMGLLLSEGAGAESSRPVSVKLRANLDISPNTIVSHEGFLRPAEPQGSRLPTAHLRGKRRPSRPSCPRSMVMLSHVDNFSSTGTTPTSTPTTSPPAERDGAEGHSARQHCRQQGESDPNVCGIRAHGGRANHVDQLTYLDDADYLAGRYPTQRDPSAAAAVVRWNP
jgi:hypothetical protein